nr:hypothetical protein [Tanacetum cinerariifolium]
MADSIETTIIASLPTETIKALCAKEDKAFYCFFGFDGSYDLRMKAGKAKFFGDTTVLGSFPSLPTHVTTSTGNAPDKPSYANITGKPSEKKVNVHTLFIPEDNGIDVVVPKWHPDENLLKEDVSTIQVWVKLHGVPVTAFSEDGLSVIATKPSTPLMLNSYTSDMCMQYWGREGHYTCNVHVEYEWKPPRCSSCKVFGHIHEECPKNTGAGEKKTMKKPSQTSRGVLVSNSNPFDVLNSVDNDVEFDTNGGNTNLVHNGTTLSGSSFMNVDNSSSGTTLIIDKIEKFEDLLTSGQAILMDKADNPLKKVEFPGEYDSEDDVASVDNDMACSMASKRVGFGTQSLLEQWRDSYGNDDYDDDPYDDDMYEGQILSHELQAICDNLDICVRDRNKK